MSGGNGGAGACADAIDFTGGTNSLTLGDAGAAGTLTGDIGITGTLSIDSGTVAGASRTLANQIRDVGSAGSIV